MYGFRAQARSALYYAYKDSFGCTCDSEACPKHLRLEGIEPPDPDSYRRVRHIVQLESMVNVGCKFQVGDLSPAQWSNLIDLAKERAWMDDHVRGVQEKVRELDRALNKAITDVRSEVGIPPPGQSIFKTSAR